MHYIIQIAKDVLQGVGLLIGLAGFFLAILSTVVLITSNVKINRKPKQSDAQQAHIV